MKVLRINFFSYDPLVVIYTAMQYIFILYIRYIYISLLNYTYCQLCSYYSIYFSIKNLLQDGRSTFRFHRLFSKIEKGRKNECPVSFVDSSSVSLKRLPRAVFQVGRMKKARYVGRSVVSTLLQGRSPTR